MKTRVSKLAHPSGKGDIETPLLVPSFSSKGFSYTKRKATKDGKLSVDGSVSSYVDTIMSGLAGVAFEPEVILVSAFDISYGFLPPPKKLTLKPGFIILDSGGYEISNDFDFSAPEADLVVPALWSVEKYKQVLDKWPDNLPAIFVSYDHPRERKPFDVQVKEARALFKGRPQLKALLLKPHSQEATTVQDVLKTAAEHVEDLAGFDIIGLTEKELGSKPLDRMVNIAKLRRALDQARMHTLIHIFGSLDPVSISLYYLAGAEIFDGLTWLKYAFDKASDHCVYLQSHGIISSGLIHKAETIRGLTHVQNYQYLRDLQERLKLFHSTKNYNHLPFGASMEIAAESLRLRMEGAS